MSTLSIETPLHILPLFLVLLKPLEISLLLALLV
jgi:hypothetical protein